MAVLKVMADMNELKQTAPTAGEALSPIMLTPEGYRRLQQELEHLTMVKRPEIADRIRDSQQHGEFSEDNSELGEVKFEQAMVEGRISELKALFGTAQVINEDEIPTDHVGMGSLVTLEDLEWGEQFEIRIVSSSEADPARDYVSNESPMGVALMDQKVGDQVDVLAPEGKRTYRIVAIKK